MKRTIALLAVAPLALWSCGGGAAQQELADALIAEGIIGADEACVRDKTAELSEDDARFLLDNMDATDTSGFSSELQAWADGLVDCIDLEAQNE